LSGTAAYEDVVDVAAEPDASVAAKITPVSAATMRMPDATAAVAGERAMLSRLIIVVRRSLSPHRLDRLQE
jgi:hypothetical protein